MKNEQIFAVVLAFAVFAIVYILNLVPTALVTAPISSQNTVMIKNIDLNEYIGDDYSSIPSSSLPGLGEGTVHTSRGLTDYETVLKLKGSFNGGRAIYDKNDLGDVGNFIYYQLNQPLFQLDLLFSRGLKSDVEEYYLEDLPDVEFDLLGTTIFFSRGRLDLSANRLDLWLETDAGEVQFSDRFDDALYSRSVKIGGRNVPAEVSISASASADQVTIYSISYRPLALSKYNGDVYQPAMTGLRGELLHTGVMLSEKFDILYGSVTSQVSIPTVSSNTFLSFDPSGSDRYTISFTNNQGRRYSIPYLELDGSLFFGRGSNRLVYSEGSSSSDFNINENDMFIVTSSTNIGGVTNVLRFSGVRGSSVFIQDLAGGEKIVQLDSSNKGFLVAGGNTYSLYADPSSNRIVVDQNSDNSFDGSNIRIVLSGGIQVQPGTSTIIRVPARLIHGESSDETTSIVFSEDNNRIDADIPSSSLNLVGSAVEKGMTKFGLLFTRSGVTPHTISVGVPSSSYSISSSSGQLSGFVLVTTERERWVHKPGATAQPLPPQKGPLYPIKK